MLSTLYTNTAIGAVTRLANMGVQPYPLQFLGWADCPAAGPHVVHSLQRAPRTRRLRASVSELEPGDDSPIYRAKGCRECAFEGYRGRVGIYEVILVDETLGEKIHTGAVRSKWSELLAISHPVLGLMGAGRC